MLINKINLYIIFYKFTFFYKFSVKLHYFNKKIEILVYIYIYIYIYIYYVMKCDNGDFRENMMLIMYPYQQLYIPKFQQYMSMLHRVSDKKFIHALIPKKPTLVIKYHTSIMLYSIYIRGRIYNI